MTVLRPFSHGNAITNFQFDKVLMNALLDASGRVSAQAHQRIVLPGGGPEQYCAFKHRVSFEFAMRLNMAADDYVGILKTQPRPVCG